MRVAQSDVRPPVPARHRSGVFGLRDRLAYRFSCSGWLSSVTPRPIRPLPRGTPVVVNDASGQNPTRVAEVIRVASLADVESAIARAKAGAKRVSVAGRRHSEGGQSASVGSLNLDMVGLCGVRLLDDRRTLRVEAGATWENAQGTLAPFGLAVQVMQASNVFTVGGSLSVNCHGRTPGRAPLISTVRQIRLLTADGSVTTCSRDINSDLFRHAIGGYGLFGVILDADLDTSVDAPCRLDVALADMHDYPQIFSEILQDRSIELAYARLAPTLTGEMLVHRVRRTEEPPGVSRSRAVPTITAGTRRKTAIATR